MGSLQCGLLYYLVTAFYFIDKIESVPIDYCLYPLNMSDCHVKPTSVFSYYKPGSRCEIEIWRGCPTFNKFDNEYECTHNCIMRMYHKGDEEAWVTEPVTEPAAEPTTEPVTEPEPVTKPEPLDDITEPQISECEEQLDIDRCSDNSSEVYTHVNGSCVKATWHGCPTRNKFDDEDTCLKVCLNETITVWEQELEELPVEQVEDIDQILEDVIDEEERLPMKQIVPSSVPQEEEIEEETEEKPKEEMEEIKEEDSEVTEKVVQPPDSGDVSEVLITRMELNKTKSGEEIE